ncbi:hypothetical protein MC885_009845 [Smutsia gigantea]|nr:hypothetical protein MC885_009845 [Smutsia gigantea]
MDRPRAPGLLWVLQTLCLTAGTPEVWVQVHTETPTSLSLTIRCGFLGSGSISLVTVSSGGRDGAGGTRLAVLHPEFGTQQWPPVHQAHWETRSSISLSLEGDPNGDSPSPNTTFCCKFASFPEGSQEACGHYSLDTDQGGADEERPREGREGSGAPPPSGLSAPTAAPILRADLAGILGVSGVLFLGCVYLLHLLHQQRHRSVIKLRPLLTVPQTPGQARGTSQAARASLHGSHVSGNTYYGPTALGLALPPQPLAQWALLPGPRVPARLSPLPASVCSSFVYMENGLYAQAGERPPHTGPNLLAPRDRLRPRAMEEPADL